MKSELVIYDLDYFIAKYEAIPPHKFCTGTLMEVTIYELFGIRLWTKVRARCAQGHCVPNSMLKWVIRSVEARVNPRSIICEIPEWAALVDITGGYGYDGQPVISLINDGESEVYCHDLVKDRILHYLRDLKLMEEHASIYGEQPRAHMVVQRKH